MPGVWRRRAPSALLLAVAIVGLALRLYLAATSAGSTDVRRWEYFTRLATDGDYRTIYFTDKPIWNQPAPALLILHGVAVLERATGWSFAFTFRLIPSLADLGNLLLIYGLARRRWGPWGAVGAASCHALSPAAITIAGFHGNTDPIMVFFILLGIWLFDRRPILACTFLGLGLGVKYPAALVLLALGLAFARSSAMAAATALAAILPFAVISWFFVHPFLGRAFHNIADYASEPGAWGLGHLRTMLGASIPALAPLLDALLSAGRLLIVTGAAGTALVNRFSQRLDPRQQATLALSFFYVFAPAFGVQYVVWILPFFILEKPLLGLVYNACASHFVVNAFLTGQRNTSGMINPDVGPTLWALGAWVSCIVLAADLMRRVLSRPAPGR